MKRVKTPTQVRVQDKKSVGTLTRILQYVWRYPVSLIGALLFAVVTVAATLVVPVFFGDAVDCIVESGVRWTQLKEIFKNRSRGERGRRVAMVNESLQQPYFLSRR